MENLKFFWKLYFHSFPTSHLAPNSDPGKAFKLGCKVAQLVQKSARRAQAESFQSNALVRGALRQKVSKAMHWCLARL